MSNTQKLGFCQVSRMEESPTLTAFVERMIRITDEMVEQIKECQIDGEYRFYANSFDVAAGDEPADFDLFIAMLAERPEIAEVDYAEDDQLYAILKPEFATYEDDSHRRKLTQAEVDVICAKHTLWLHENSGEQADFTDCLLKGIDFSNRELDCAIFKGAKMVDCNLHETKLNGADFSNAKMYYCCAVYMQAKNSNFKGAFMQMCDLGLANLLHSNFSQTIFSNSNGGQSNMSYCCFDGTFLDGLSRYRANMSNASQNEAAWLANQRKPGLTVFTTTRKKDD